MPYTEANKWNFTVDSIHNVGTYAGCLEGPPSVESTMEGVKEDAKRYFYSEPFVIVPPEVKEHPVHHPFMKVLKTLPRWTHFAMFHGPAVKDKDADGSVLGVIWFDDDPQSKLAERDILLQVDWDKHARDFQY